MLFQFQLCLLDKIEPWGGEKPSLSWFGLTDGWYWWNIGSQEIFRYSHAHQCTWTNNFAEFHSASPYVNYQIARSWEDLLQGLPAILDPVPDDLIQSTQNAEQWQMLQNQVWRWASAKNDDEAWDIQETAFLWWSKRGWNSGYLRHPLEMWLWRQDDTFHLRWDNRGVISDGLPVWDATFGEITMPVTAFIEEVKSFDRRLMAAMAERVAAACSDGLRSDIYIDLDWLVHEQQDRSTWLENALRKTDEKSNWEKVREALATVEQMCYNNTVEGP